MKTLSAIVIAGLLTLGASAATFLHGPYSGAPSSDSVVISWRLTEPIAARVEYGPVENGMLPPDGMLVIDMPASDSEQPETAHISLTSLAPNTEYAYRVVLEGSEGIVESPLGRFVTAPPAGQPVEFLVLADTQWQWEGENRLAAIGSAIAADPTPVDFILHAGDLVETPAAHIWEHWFDAFGDMLLRAPFIPVLGNHEKNHGSYYDIFEHPPGDGKRDERWWALHWGDVVVVGLDTTVRRADQIMDQQDWVKQHMSGSEPHKIVMFHYPVFSSDAFHGSGYSYDVIYHPIFVETGVDMVINGHAHNYERIYRDGVTYLVVGGGGAVPRALAPTMIEGSQVAVEGENFYLRVRTDSEGITAEAISLAVADDTSFQLTDGDTLDLFTVSDRPSTLFGSPIWIVLVLGLLGAAAGLLLVRSLAR